MWGCCLAPRRGGHGLRRDGRSYASMMTKMSLMVPSAWAEMVVSTFMASMMTSLSLALCQGVAEFFRQIRMERGRLGLGAGVVGRKDSRPYLGRFLDGVCDRIFLRDSSHWLSDIAGLVQSDNICSLMIQNSLSHILYGG